MSVIKMFDEGELSLGLSDTLQVYSEKHSFDVYRVFIDEEITNPSKYRHVINVLEGASEDDIIEFRLNTIGGQLFAALPMYNGILNTEAKTRAIIDGPVISAGTFLALACDSVIVMKNTTMMCHAATWGAWGDMKTVRDQVDFQFKYTSKLNQDIYEGFLTEEEIDKMVEHSKEYWMQDDEIIQRLKNRQEYMKAKGQPEDDPEFGVFHSGKGE